MAVFFFNPKLTERIVAYGLEKYLSTDNYKISLGKISLEYQRNKLKIIADQPRIDITQTNSSLTALTANIDVATENWRNLNIEAHINSLSLDHLSESAKIDELSLLCNKHLKSEQIHCNISLNDINHSAVNTIPLQQLDIAFSRDQSGHEYKLEQLNAHLGDSGSLTLSGLLDLDYRGRPITLKSTGAIDNFDVANWKFISHFYNNDIIGPTWNFLEEFIESGIINGSWNLDLDHGFFENNNLISNSNLSGNFTLAGVTLNYGPEFAKVTNIASAVRLMGTKLVFNIIEAKTASSNLTKGLVALNLAGDDNFVHVLAKATGPVRDLVDFIPLETRDKLKKDKIDLSEATGEGITDIELIIPLDEKPIDYNIQTTISNLAVNLFEQAVQVQKGQLKGSYTGDALILNGSAKLNDYDSLIAYQSLFAGISKHTIDVNFKLPHLPVKNEFMELTHGYGNAKVNITNSAGITNILADVDLTNAEFVINLLDVTKPKNIKSKAVITASLTDTTDGPINFALTSADGLSINMDVKYTSSIWKIDVRKAQTEHFDLKGELLIGDDKISANLKSNMLDLSMINFDKIAHSNEHKDHNNIIAPSKPSKRKKVNLDVQIGRTKMKNNIWLDNAMLHLVCSPTICDTGSFVANVGSKTITVDLDKQNKIEEWYVHTDNAGALFQALGVYKNLKSGVLSMTLKRHTGEPTKPITGDIMIKEFVTTNASFITRIVSFISLPGIMNAITNNKNLRFKSIQGNFEWQDGVINILHAYTDGPYFDFTLRGTIDTNNRTTNLKGTITPSLYGISTLVQKVPLIGNIFSSKKRSGLLNAPFTIKDKY